MKYLPQPMASLCLPVCVCMCKRLYQYSWESCEWLTTSPGQTARHELTWIYRCSFVITVAATAAAAAVIVVVCGVAGIPVKYAWKMIKRKATPAAMIIALSSFIHCIFKQWIYENTNFDWEFITRLVQVPSVIGINTFYLHGNRFFCNG